VNEKYTKEKNIYVLIYVTKRGRKEKKIIYNYINVYKSVLTSERVRYKVLINGSSFRFIPRPSGNSSRG